MSRACKRTSSSGKAFKKKVRSAKTPKPVPVAHLDIYHTIPYLGQAPVHLLLLHFC